MSLPRPFCSLGLLCFLLFADTAVSGETSRHASEIPIRHWILLTLVLSSLPLAYAPRLQRWGGRMEEWVRTHPRRISLAIAGTFLLLVALGITGSSMQLLSKSPWNNGGNGTVEFHGQASRLFKLRGIRSDEWLVLAPNTLAQWNHEPPFPVVNENLGSAGQNMGVIGMTGVPIAQPAAIARPATWGFFGFPLRQALSWHWQFAFFACLFFLWKALGLLSPCHPGFNLLLAITFCVQPYAAAWSLWPLYAAFFPLALFVSAASVLRTSHLGKAAVLGAIMGILLAGWVLVLYPPWQITTGTLIAALAAGWTADHWNELQFRSRQWIGFGLAALIAAMLLGSWWLDTSDAIAQIRATVYPGARTALQGGELNAPWWTLRGYLNPDALTFGTGPGVNQSEISSYILFPLPILLLGLWHCGRSCDHRWTMRACLGFLIFCLIFRFTGIPLWLAKLSLWSHVTSARLDLAMALACTVIMGLIYANHFGATALRTPVRTWLALGTALASAGLVILEFALLPPGVLRVSSAPLQLAMLFAVGYGAWWMMRGQMRAAAFMMLFLSLVSTLGFNPLSKAPRAVQLSASSAALASTGTQPHRALRTLAISDSATPSMLLAATGVPTVGGVLYYPHQQLWKNIKLAPQDWPVVNRYQHLTFSLDKLETPLPFKVHSAQPDTVNVTLDPRRFDFAATGAERVVALEKDAMLLRSSPALAETGYHGGLFWFEVRSNGTSHIPAAP